MSKEVKKKKKKKFGKFILFLFILLIAGGLIYFAIKPNNKTKNEQKKVVDTIDNFEYTVSENATKLFKSEFKKLKNELSKDEINNEEYASLVSKLFIIDFFTLDNKATKNEVGGVQFVYDNYRKTFIDKARDEFYKYVRNNLNNDRTQKLPVVSSIEVTSCEKKEASSLLKGDEFSQIDEAYEVNLTWEYEEDLGYQKTGKVVIIKNNDKLVVAKLSN